MVLENPTIWISHRGFHAEFLENTRPAFDAALAAGFSYLETDLRTTADGYIVLHHDSDTIRTYGRSLIIEKSRLKDLQSLADELHPRILTFDEFMATYAGFSWTFDLKPESVHRTIALLKTWSVSKNAEYWLSQQARFLCWSNQAEKHLLQEFPHANCLAKEQECYRAGLSVLAKLPFLGAIKANRTYTLPRFFMGRDLFRKEIVRPYHERGARLLAYLPGSEQDARAAIEAGFDEVLTNLTPITV